MGLFDFLPRRKKENREFNISDADIQKEFDDYALLDGTTVDEQFFRAAVVYTLLRKTKPEDCDRIYVFGKNSKRKIFPYLFNPTIGRVIF